MVSPVLVQELQFGSRRGWQQLFRRLFTGWLALQLLGYYWMYWLEATLRQQYAGSEVFGSLLNLLVMQQLLLVVLVTPAFTAGAITDEKARGTLQYLLVADVTAWEIIAGKLLGRMSQVLQLALATLPLLCLVLGFSGLGARFLIVLIVVTLIPLFGMAAASVLASVWSRQTRDAVLSLYAVGLLAYLALWAAGLAYLFDPLYALEPAWALEGWSRVGSRMLVLLAAWGSLGALCLGLAVWRLRGAYVRQLENTGPRTRKRWWRAPVAAVSEEPIRWKERHVEGLAPLAALRRIPRWLAIVLLAGVTSFSSILILATHLNAAYTLERLLRTAANLQVLTILNAFAPMTEAFVTQALVVLFLATFVVGIRCSGAVTGERERQTWEALLLTPLPVRELIRGKLWGIVGASYPYLLAYAVPALLLACFGGPLTLLAVVLCLGLTWLAMGFVGAAGLWCSVRAKTSWRALLGMIGWGYVAGAVLYTCTIPVIMITFLLITLTLYLIDRNLAASFRMTFDFFFIGSCLGMVGVFLGMTWYFIASAEKYVADRERIRHWREEPTRRRRRRRPQRLPH